MDQFLKAKKGSRRAFKTLMKQYGPGVYGCFYKITQSEQQAKDLYKSLWLRFYAEIKTMSPPFDMRLFEIVEKLIEDAKSHRSPYGQEVTQYLNPNYLEFKRLQNLTPEEKTEIFSLNFINTPSGKDAMGHTLFSPLDIPEGLQEEILPFIKSRKKTLMIAMIIFASISYTALSWDAMPFADDIEDFLSENPLVPEKEKYDFELEVGTGILDEDELIIDFQIVAEQMPEDMSIKARLTKFAAPSKVVSVEEGYQVIFDLSEVEMKTKNVELNLDFMKEDRVVDAFSQEVRVKNKPFERIKIELEDDFIAEGVVVHFKSLEISEHRITLTYTLDNDEGYITSFIFFQMKDDLGNTYYGGGGSGHDNEFEIYFEGTLNPDAQKLIIEEEHANHFKVNALTLEDQKGEFEYGDHVFKIMQVDKADVPDDLAADIKKYGKSFYIVETDQSILYEDVPRLFFHDGVEWSYMQMNDYSYRATVTVEDFIEVYGDEDVKEIDDYQKMINYYKETYGKILNIHHLQYEMENMVSFVACEVTVEEHMVGQAFYYATYFTNQEGPERIGYVDSMNPEYLDINFEIELK